MDNLRLESLSVVSDKIARPIGASEVDTANRVLSRNEPAFRNNPGWLFSDRKAYYQHACLAALGNNLLTRGQ